MDRESPHGHERETVRRAVESERKYMIEAQHTITLDQAMAAMGRVASEHPDVYEMHRRGAVYRSA